ncbi:beta-lactamase class A [Actinokineospora cianjurensis]|uniref:Beta-lactamase n=1 Tax=Actinokineospora cianjurensis TaxID=585224 RepID=A0A421B0Y7_9PSEU|nr:class A beta-lactamase [Actinokineospora cianjurensis]RLK58044.1 beta-lactamase class A [Actinokineospora cianjurensis]
MAVLVAGCSAGQVSGGAPPAGTTTASSAEAVDAALVREFAQLEGKYDARLGVYAVDTGRGRAVAYRADERFAYASTFKAFAAALVLDATTPQQLEESVPIRAADLVANSPVVERAVGGTMTWRELCDAAVRYSDNAAGNLLLRRIGGPAGLKAGLAALGDQVTSADRYEPDLSSAIPGDPRDTSTPRAMATNLRQFAVGSALSEEDQMLLNDWLRNNTTGKDVIRAGVPRDWTVGDKTGSADYGGRNDIAVLWPPGRDPIVIAVLTSRDKEGAERSDALVADTARVVARVFG